MKIELTILTENAVDETINLNTYIREHNVKGVMTEISEKPVEKGAMNIADYLPMIQMVLGSGGVVGLITVIKSYYETKINAEKEIKLAEIKAQKELAIANRQEDTKQALFELTTEIDGKKYTLKCNVNNYQQVLADFQQQLLEAPKNND